jgi:hypothetical protein
MKKIMILMTILLIGCSNVEETNYSNYVKTLINKKEFSEEVDYKINLYYFNHENTLMYQLVLDDVKLDMNNIELLVVHNHKTSDIFPNIGIFDEKPNLYLNQNPKGINLIGYIDELDQEKIIFKIMVKYNDTVNYHVIESEQI